MIELMGQYSNQRRRHDYGEKSKEIDEIEFMLLIDLFLRAGLDKDYLRPIGEFFGVKPGSLIYRVTLSHDSS